MASFASSTFTTGERRKKAITYGKSSRPPPLRPSIIERDAPSPERPRKSTTISSEPTTEAGRILEDNRTPGNARAATNSPDVFDVPSEDEFESQSKPAQKPAIPHSKTEGCIRTKTVKKDALVPSGSAAITSRPSKQIGVVKEAGRTNKTLQEQTRPQQPVRVQSSATKVPHTSATPQEKALQRMQDPKKVTKSGHRLQRSNTSSKTTSRATSPSLSSQPALERRPLGGMTSTVPNKRATKSTIRHPPVLDVFDVPSDEDEASLPIPDPPSQIARQALKGDTRELSTSKLSSIGISKKMLPKSTELGDLQNRKRKSSLSSFTVPKPVVPRTQEPLIAQRERKVAKRVKETSPGHASMKTLNHLPAPQAGTPDAATIKPRRTRMRTVPVISPSVISKGQSSPAVLHKMVPKDAAPKTSLENEATETPASDDTMYDIPDMITTPVRPTPLRSTTTSTPGSVTPRQKDLFSTLLGSATAPKTPASALASLQLTEKKPRSLLGALARSKSDLTYSSQSRKTRLIDTLKDEVMSSDDDESDSDEEHDNVSLVDTTPRAKFKVVEQSTDDINMDTTAAADSQTSQTTSAAVSRPKLTYAAQRSYLQEANPEDEFLLSMNLDDSWKMDSQTVSTDDEDGPASQVRTHRELKKYGQNTMFSWDMQESIHEISSESSKSARRSAMLELCTKMADSGFVSQLLDSGFTHKLLESITSTSDIIFDFIAATSVLFILQTKPAFAVVDQIYRSSVTATLINMADNDVDISRIARDRKSNMSKIAQESLADLRSLLLSCKVWLTSAPGKASPQLLALGTIDILVRSLRESGSAEALLAPADVSKIVHICATTFNRTKVTKSCSQDLVTIDLVLSILETVSIADQDYSTWPTKVLQQLVDFMPIFFEDNGLSKTVEAMKLCMNLTNNKPKACQPFSVQAFVQPLIRFIVGRFDLLHSGELDTERRTHVLAALTLSLGAMINLAELSDEARLNTVDDENSIEALVKTFVTGSERAAKVCNTSSSHLC